MFRGKIISICGFNNKGQERFIEDNETVKKIDWVDMH